MIASNERTQGAKRLELAAFPWVQFRFDRIDADRLNLSFRWTECCRPAVLEPISNA